MIMPTFRDHAIRWVHDTGNPEPAPGKVRLGQSPRVIATGRAGSPHMIVRPRLRERPAGSIPQRPRGGPPAGRADESSPDSHRKLPSTTIPTSAPVRRERAQFAGEVVGCASPAFGEVAAGVAAFGVPVAVGF